MTKKSTSEGSSIVAGIFDEEEAAGRAVYELMEAGFDPSTDISVIEAHRRQHEEVAVPLKVKIGAGAKVGAAIGALVGAASAVALATGLVSGPVGLIAAGPIVAALEGGYGGGAAGWLVGALTGMGFWKQEADFHAAHIHGGVVWVGVHAHDERADLAHKILVLAGAKHFKAS